MPSREDEFYVNRKEEHTLQYRRVLCYYCGSEELVYDQNGKLWICQNERCSHYEIPVYFVSGFDNRYKPPNNTELNKCIYCSPIKGYKDYYIDYCILHSKVCKVQTCLHMKYNNTKQCNT